jgi:hypothetical protein
MVSYGRRHCAVYADPSTKPIGATYYDAARVYYNIAEYTADASWKECALKAGSTYRDAYVIPNDGKVPGYWNFTTGLRMDWEQRRDPISRDTVQLLASHGSYCWTSYPSQTESAQLSRETAYCMIAFVNAIELGFRDRPDYNPYWHTHQERLMFLANHAFGHIDQWFVSRTARAPSTFSGQPEAAGKYYLQPFMVGLTVEALIQFDELVGDVRVRPAVEIALESLWQRAWVSADESFWYENWVARPEDAFPKKPGAPDLNLLIAKGYAWLFSKTGDTKWRDRGDSVFAGGIKGAWLGNTKQFNQNYMLSFDYVRLRSN